MKDEMKNVRDNDVISGAWFRKFLESYRAYDTKQKNIINSLVEQNNELRRELEKFKAPLPSDKSELEDIIMRQRVQLAQQLQKIASLKKHITTIEIKKNKI